uniref:Uncharacterized protein n=1 Tax=Aegilops tauschii subsp. strangulata TaxID=200361 RepID=A0A453BRV4_AEGTS
FHAHKINHRVFVVLVDGDGTKIQTTLDRWFDMATVMSL